ncbi:MAG TPA: hypothetical protein VGP76_11435 [Planctomycetaceae bacterium]|jgi:hypothetical protein|nr:hypothetical protein [Planctomycetaceae bacterium]
MKQRPSPVLCTKPHFLFSLLCVLGCVVPQIARGDNPKAPILSPEIRRCLAWLPVDTETLVAAQSFALPSSKELGHRTQNSKSAEPVFNDWLHVDALEGFFEADGGKFLDALAGKKVALALRGARNYDVVSAFGSLRSEGCVVLTFENNFDATDKRKLAALLTRRKEIRRISGRDAFVFPSTTVMESVFKPELWQGTFIVLLDGSTLLCATSDRYLQEVLRRVDTKPADRALADDLPEWKHLDLNAPAWLLRHVPVQRRVISGLTLSADRNGFRLIYLPFRASAADVASQVRALWIRAADPPPEIRPQEDGAILVSSTVVEPRFVWAVYHLEGEGGLLNGN